MDLPLPVLVYYSHLLALFYLFFSTTQTLTIMLVTPFLYLHITHAHTLAAWILLIFEKHFLFILTQILSQLESDTSRLGMQSAPDKEKVLSFAREAKWIKILFKD